MRRLFPILLLAGFLLQMFSPLLLAMGRGGESQMPACCRRNGQHHCAMSMGEKSGKAAADTAPRWSAPASRCPYCPATAAPGGLHETPAAAAQALYAEMVSHPACVAQTECKRRMSRDRSRQKRGPPSLSI